MLGASWPLLLRDYSTMPPADDRTREIATLIHELERQGIRDDGVLAALARVPRERFVPDAFRDEAWENVALPIAAHQTISQPYVVALMTQALRLSGTERVLEIGTGSGYQTAILAELSAEIISIERHEMLARAARGLLRNFGYINVTIHVGDGSRGWPDGAPYDRIIVTAAAPDLIPAFLNQLVPLGGRLVIPVGAHTEQQLIAVERHGQEVREQHLGPVRFVPLVGSEGWDVTAAENGHRRQRPI
jgi:protein-L-isoaspartate(D-aspartate) O-methyltransferase